MSPLVSLLAATLALAATTQAAPLSALKGAANVEGAARQRRASTTSLQLSSTNNWSKRSNRRACAGDRCPSSRFNYNKNLKTGESCASGLRTSAAIRATRSADVQRFSSAQLVSAGSTTINGVSYDKFKFGGARTYSGQASDPLVIGSGGDCSTWSSCLTDNHRGGFKVSLAGTGYIFSSESKVELRGWGSSMRAKADGVVVKNQRSGSGKAALVPFGATTIETVCGGWCGQCIANLVVLKRVDTAKPAPVVPPPSSNKPRLVNKGGTAYNLLECHGDCDRDSDCQGTLKCFQRNGNQPVPGCASGGSGDVRGYDFCYKPVTQVPKPPVVPPSSNKPRLVNKGGTAYNLLECHGDCDRDSDCQGTLKCFQRNGNQPVPGCASGGSGDVRGYDFCYKPVTQVPKPPVVPPSSNKPATTVYTYPGTITRSQASGAVSEPSRSNLKLTKDFTVSIWANPSQRVGGWARVLGKGSSYNRNFGLWIHPDGRVLSQVYGPTGTNVWNVKGANAPLNTWTHVAATFSAGKQHTLYINGAPVGSLRTTGTPRTDNEPLTLGKAAFHTGFAGSLAKARVSAFAMSAAQIKAEFAFGKPATTRPQIPTCRSGQYRFGSAPGVCKPCSNQSCKAGYKRTGSCSGTTNGYKCVVIPDVVCGTDQHRQGSAPGTCHACKNAVCPAGQRRTGSCSGTTNGYKCVVIPDVICGTDQHRQGSAPGTCHACKNAVCPAGQRRTGSCSGTTNGYKCVVIPDVVCGTDQHRQGSAPGTCHACKNAVCPAGQRRTGSCSGTTNGYKCVVIPDVVCGTDQHRQGSAPGTCHACKNAVCPAGQRRTGSCSGTTNGYKCVVIPDVICGADQYRQGSAPGTCHACKNAVCPAGQRRTGSCSGTTNGYKCVVIPDVICGTDQHRQGSAPGTCHACKNAVCPAGQRRTGSCSGTTNGYKCVVIPDVVCGTDQHRQGSAPGTCHACKNTVCPAGQRRTGSCSGTTNGYKCVVIPVCTTGSTNTKAMLSKLKPAAENFQECHDSVEGITNNLGDLKKGVVSAGDAAEKIHDVTSKIDTLLTKINKRGGVGSLLGKIPKVGIFIKMGLKTAGRIAEPLAKLTQLFEVSTTKLERAVKATEKLFVKMSKVTSPVSTLLTEGHGALQAAHVCAGQYVCDQAAGDMENANRKAYPQAAGVLSTISTAGQACATALSPVEAAIRALTAMARDMQQFLQPLADLLAEVGKFIDAMEDEIAKFMAALNDNKAVQCALEIFEPITDLANLATCPVDEAVAAVFHGIVDNLMKLVTDLVDKASKKLITDAVDALVPDDLHLTVPDFKKHLPSEFWLATCTIASLKFPDHASIIQQLNRAELPYTVTGKSIEQDILAEVIPATRLTTPTTEGYTSACVEAFKELGTDYKACSQLSYVPDRSLPSYQGCRQHYEEFPLTCTRCYTPTWSNPFPGCDTYNRAPVCPKGQELNWANICLSPCQEGYHDVLEVCWMDGI